MTKYSKNKGAPDVPIVASNNTEETYYCNKCHYRLIEIEEGMTRFCTHCQSRYAKTHDVRHGLIQETMDGPIVDGQVFIAGDNPSVSYAPEPTLKKKKKEYKGGTKILSERATINITGYVEGRG